MTIEKIAIIKELARLTGRKVETIEGGITLKNLVSESFVLIEIMIELQEIYDIRIQQEDMLGIKTVDDLVALVNAKKA